MTPLIPYNSGVFQIRFDFLSHELAIETSANQTVLNLILEVAGGRNEKWSLTVTHTWRITFKGPGYGICVVLCW